MLCCATCGRWRSEEAIRWLWGRTIPKCVFCAELEDSSDGFWTVERMTVLEQLGRVDADA